MLYSAFLKETIAYYFVTCSANDSDSDVLSSLLSDVSIL
jgi:hypothetical protein